LLGILPTVVTRDVQDPFLQVALDRNLLSASSSENVQIFRTKFLPQSLRARQTSAYLLVFPKHSLLLLARNVMVGLDYE